MIKKTFLALINFLSLVIIAAAIAVLCMVVFTPSGKTPNIAGYSFLRITTGSMEPTYGVDTMIVVKKTEPSEIKVGDVISFYSSDPALGRCGQYAPCDGSPARRGSVGVHDARRCQQRG